MITDIMNGFFEFFGLSSFIYMNLGVLLGIVFGSIPGLTVMLAIVLFLPLTYGLETIDSFMFLLGIYCGGGYGGSISAIMIRTPGTPHAAATMLDGAPLAEKGFAKKALNIALIASTIGGVFSALVLLFLSPQVAKIAMNFGAPEYFVLCVFGLSIIAGVSGDNIVKGIMSGCIGLFLSMVGIDTLSGTFRFTFGNYNLYGGLQLVVVLIGLFAISEVLNNVHKKNQKLEIDLKQMGQGEDITKKDMKRIFPPITRSSIIGVIVGSIPGTGASIASFMSYDQAKKKSKKPEEFGKGSIEGVAAAEAANNAVTGATLIPLLTLGVPGDGVAAILLGAFMMNGLIPGPNLFKEHTVTIYAIMVGLIFTNIFMYFQGKYLAKYFAKVSLVPSEILAPLIIILCTAGAFSLNNSLFDVIVVLVIGIISYLLIRFGFSPIPILLGLVLGGLTESNFRRAMIMSQGSLSIFITRPISLFFICILIGSIILMVVKSKKNKRVEQNV